MTTIFDEFDVERLLNMILNKDVFLLPLRRTDRKLAKIIFHKHTHDHNEDIVICAEEYQTDDIVYGQFTLKENNRLQDFGKFLTTIIIKMNSYKECEYCDVPFSDHSSKICNTCIGYDISKIREQCIICTRSEYPTKFRCMTCLDSRICISCTSNALFKNVCPTCKKPEVLFGQKRKRVEDDSDFSDED
jgi:hypothetical protein